MPVAPEPTYTVTPAYHPDLDEDQYINVVQRRAAMLAAKSEPERPSVKPDYALYAGRSYRLDRPEKARGPLRIKKRSGSGLPSTVWEGNENALQTNTLKRAGSQMRRYCGEGSPFADARKAYLSA